jgi:hypothetical protein
VTSQHVFLTFHRKGRRNLALVTVPSAPPSSLTRATAMRPILVLARSKPRSI